MAYAKLLELSHDYIGHEAIAVCFRQGKDKKVEQKNKVDTSKLDAREVICMRKAMEKSLTTDEESEVIQKLEQFKSKQNNNGLFNNVLILQVKFKECGISKVKDVQTMKPHELQDKLYPIQITFEMQTIMKEVFDYEFKNWFPFNTLVGKGYDIFSDSSTELSPLMLLECKGTCSLPPEVDVNSCSSNEVVYTKIKSPVQYVEARLQQLSVVGNVQNYNEFKTPVRCGYNLKSPDQKENQSSFLVEQRIKEVKLKTPYKTNKSFRDELKSLPPTFNLSDTTNITRWRAFMRKWGTHIVIHAYLGGYLKRNIHTDEKTLDQNTFEKTLEYLCSKFYFLNQGDDSDIFHTILEESLINVHTCLEWTGGDQSFCKTTLDDLDTQNWNEWVKSLEIAPISLSQKLTLFPTYELVSKIDNTKGRAMKEAWKHAINETSDLFIVPEDDNRQTVGKSLDLFKCFHEDAMITLMNGKNKHVKDIKPGDGILSLDENGFVKEDTMVTW